jgi:hypothetical protein
MKSPEDRRNAAWDAKNETVLSAHSQAEWDMVQTVPTTRAGAVAMITAYRAERARRGRPRAPRITRRSDPASGLKRAALGATWPAWRCTTGAGLFAAGKACSVAIRGRLVIFPRPSQRRFLGRFAALGFINGLIYMA